MKRRNKSHQLWLLALVFFGTVLQAQTNQPEAKPASVSGVVISSTTGEPLAHAHVRLDLFAEQKSSRYGAMTTGDGRFAIKAIAPGHYLMTVDRRGYQPLTGQEENTQHMEFKAGEQVHDLVVRLTPDAVISGRVIDAKGLPMDSVEVEAIAGDRHYAVTDDRGEFRIGGLREGRYLVKASANQVPMMQEIRTDGTTAINYGPNYYPSSPDAKSAAPVPTRAGQETSGIEIKLVRTPVLHLSGTVSGVHAENVDVILDSGDRQRSFRAESDMHFSIWRVPPGHYQVFAQSALDGSIRSAPVDLDLTITSVNGLHLDLGRPFELSGRVQVEGGATIPRPEGSSPSILLQPLGSILHANHDEYLGREGSFKIANVSPARYHVILSGASDDLYVKSVSLGGAEFADGVLDLRHGSSARPLTVLLGTRGAQVSGVVRDNRGPVREARVALFFDDEFGFDLAGTAITHTDGGYVLQGIAPGKYRILAYNPKTGGGAWSRESLALYETVTENLDVAAGDKITQDLKLLP